MKASVVLFDLPNYRPFHAIECGGKFYRLDATGSGRFHQFRALLSQRWLAKRARLQDVTAKERPYFQGFLEGMRKASK